MAEPSAVKSPCVNICALDEQDICTGCYRSAAEIADWTQLSDEQKRGVITAADGRYRASWGLGNSPAGERKRY